MKSTILNILLPVDFSDASLNALNTAVKMASRHQADLLLLYTRDISASESLSLQPFAVQNSADEKLKKDVFLLEQVAKAVTKEYRVNCRLDIATGYGSAAISDAAVEHRADIIILGMPLEDSNRSYLYDSMAYKVVCSAPCHVLTIPEKTPVNNFKHVIYPVQSNGRPMAKLPIAQAIVESNNADLSVVRILQTDNLHVRGSISHFADRIRATSRRFANSVRSLPLYTDNAAGSLIKLCLEEVANLIVIEADTRRNVKEFFFGNFTQKMIRNGNTAVLCAKPGPLSENLSERIPMPPVPKLQWN